MDSGDNISVNVNLAVNESTNATEVARALRNEKARARYAAMDPAKKAQLLSNKRHQRSVSRLGSCSRTFDLGSLGAALPILFLDNVDPPSTLRRPNANVDRFRMVKDVTTDPWILPSQNSCSYCGAFRFFRECPGFCCGSGQISLARTVLCPIMWFLFTNESSEVAREFRRRGRTYNGAFAFTSCGMTIDPQSWWARDGVYALKVLGQVSHFFNAVDGSPNTGDLLQLFFLDTATDLDAGLLESKELRGDIMELLIQAFSNNPYSTFFKRLRSWESLADAHIVLRSSPALDQRNYNLPTADQVAAVWREGDEAVVGSERDIRVYTDAGHKRQIKYYYSCYDPLQYPTLFPFGEPGWHAGIDKNMLPLSTRKRKGPSCTGEAIAGPSNFVSAEAMLHVEEQVLRGGNNAPSKVSCREYYCYKVQMREKDHSYLLHAGRIGQQFIIDMYIKLETSRLDYYRSEQIQKDLRTESYQGIIDSLGIDGQTMPSNVGQKVVLPSSFIGGPRDMRRRYVNAMALVQRFGKPDLFITITCNPAWKEIREHLLPGQKPDDRPDLVARVFRAKLEELKNDIVKKKLFGQVAAYVYTVEYQKRGLPHAHWVILLDYRHKIVSPEVYDEFISAELPDSSHPLLRSYVVKHMMHGPCGAARPSNVCMRDGNCKNHYPKEFSDLTLNGQNSYPIYRRRDNGRTVVVRDVLLDNRWVVPYCPYLLAKYDCHINVEICADVKLVKYLYKYIHKGHDKVSYNIVSNLRVENQDEIQAYQAGRWVCAPEAFWRIFSFNMSETFPPVIVIPVHLPDHQPLRFGSTQSLEEILANPMSSKTMLTEFFFMNGSDLDAKRLNLLYKEFPEYFVWESVKRRWKLRKKQVVVGRMCTVNPVEGERYFERLLLVNVRCPVSFDDLMSANGIKYGTFREAAVARGLLETDEYVDSCLAEAALFQAPYCLRVLFAMLLVYGITAEPQLLWDRYYSSFSEDFLHKGLSEFEVLKETVSAIDVVLTAMDKCISDFPICFFANLEMESDRLSRDYHHECSMPVSNEDIMSMHCLNVEQQTAYDTIVRQLDSDGEGVYFLDGPGGTGKTFLYRALLAYVRCKKSIALAVASSGVAASLLPGGRTAHSRFKLPIDVSDISIGKISKQTSLAKMIIEAKLIIWDEASMASKHSIESFERLLRDLMGSPNPFGGKIVLFGGDFRQTLPIVVRGSRDAMIEASFVSSKLWSHVTRLQLCQNMRAREDPSFVEFLLRVGDGEEPYVLDDNIRIPYHMLIPFTDESDSLDRLIESVYPSFESFSSDPYSMINRAILTPKNDCVDEINDLLLDRFPGQAKEYISFNRTNDAIQQGEYEDYLSTVSASGLPSHRLRLKKNCPVMLLRNLNPVQGLCNGTRLICRELGDNFIKAEIAVGDFRGNHVFIPRIPLESSDKLKCPIPFKRMQIPVRPCFVMTINKAQGQTLDFVGVYLREPVFSHGQLYVALSRAKCSQAIKLLIHPSFAKEDASDYTRNIVYRIVFELARGALGHASTS